MKLHKGDGKGSGRRLAVTFEKDGEVYSYPNIKAGADARHLTIHKVRKAIHENTLLDGWWIHLDDSDAVRPTESSWTGKRPGVVGIAPTGEMVLFVDKYEAAKQMGISHSTVTNSIYLGRAVCHWRFKRPEEDDVYSELDGRLMATFAPFTLEERLEKANRSLALGINTKDELEMRKAAEENELYRPKPGVHYLYGFDGNALYETVSICPICGKILTRNEEEHIKACSKGYKLVTLPGGIIRAEKKKTR